MYTILEKTITFSWEAEELFSRIIRQSAYYARSRQTSETEDSWEIIGLSDDEKNYLTETLSDTFRKLFSLFTKSTTTLPETLFVNQKETEDSSPSYGFSIEKSSDESGNLLFNTNRLELMDGLCSEYAVNGVLLKWSILNGLTDESTVRTAEQEQIARRIQAELHYLRIGNPERCYILA